MVSLSEAQDPFQYNHPELEWKTIETEHFKIHFHQGTQRTAQIVGNIAEDIYHPMTGLYDYEPEGKIHFIIKDTDDYSNGGAYFFDNKVEIWAENLDYVMRGTKNWLRDVVTHEFAHMISIQKSIKFSRTVPYGFFQYFQYEPERRKDVVRGFPNTIVSYPISSITIPVWFAEGVAQYQAKGARFDYRDPQRETILRDRIIHDKMLSYSEMGVFGKNSHGNESSYNLGFAFVKYICEKFGEEILAKITAESAKISVITFDEALENAAGISAESLYEEWVSSLKTNYQQKLKTILENEEKGVAIETEGFSNLFPVWSPAGDRIVYISNKGSDSFGQNRLVIYDLIKDKKTNLPVAGITSSISWSPDGRYILYSSHDLDTWSGSSYRDLYVYDLEDKKIIRLTKNMRAKNPAWNHDGTKIAFAAETNGLNQLFLYHIEDLTSHRWQTYYIDKESGYLLTNNDETLTVREIGIRDGQLTQLVFFTDGRQIYHPRWSPDDLRLVMGTSVDYGRDIAMYNFADSSFKILLSGKEELRYPVFHPVENILYYTSAQTGIYNLYRHNLDTGQKALLTNVSGGAMMPDVNKAGQIVYTCYDNVGFHIYQIQDPQEINPAKSVYEDNYPETVPDKNFDDSKLSFPVVSAYKQEFTGLHIMPRLLIDYGTFKPGLYLFATDVLDKMMFIAGADANLNLDYDLYGIFEYREFFPTFFLEAYNLSQNITDSLAVRTGKEFEYIEQDINFDLTEIQAGFSFYLPEVLQWRLAYRMSLYHAKLQWFDPFVNDIVNFRYRYLNGKAVEVRVQADHVKYDQNSAINPSGGRFVQLKYTFEDNDFLVDFDTGKNIGLEVYQKYVFNKFELDWEEYFSNPFLKHHAFSIRLQAGYIDRPVDDFFYLWAGGLIGMRGYSYFSIGGTNKLITTFTYRFPIFENIDWQIFNLYFDKLYFGVFYDYGNAWDGNGIYTDDFKRDVGFQLRLNVFSNYLFPTRVFWEAVYPIDAVQRINVRYGNDWRYYFGILFEFDIRERHGSPSSTMRLR
jgi:Tol biopolymer transport system component